MPRAASIASHSSVQHSASGKTDSPPKMYESTSTRGVEHLGRPKEALAYRNEWRRPERLAQPVVLPEGVPVAQQVLAHRALLGRRQGGEGRQHEELAHVVVLEPTHAHVLEQGEHWCGRVVGEKVDRLRGRRGKQGMASRQQVARLVEADETRRLGRPRALAPLRLGPLGATHDHLRRARLKDGQLGEHGLAARAEQPLPSPRRMRARNRRDERARARRVCMQGSPLHHPRRVRAP